MCQGLKELCTYSHTQITYAYIYINIYIHVHITIRTPSQTQLHTVHSHIYICKYLYINTFIITHITITQSYNNIFTHVYNLILLKILWIGVLLVNPLKNTMNWGSIIIIFGASLVAQLVKNLPAMQETQVQFPGWEDPLEEGMEYPLQYSCLENPHGQRSPTGYSWWCRRVRHDWLTSTAHHHLCFSDDDVRSRVLCNIAPLVSKACTWNVGNLTQSSHS